MRGFIAPIDPTRSPMARSLLVFQKQGIEAIPAPTDFLSPPGRSPADYITGQILEVAGGWRL
ncbi:hypothetical protein [Phormidium sp. CCY1219]|uniref:hypothetical protein n=1 Tax=Phormidium sp. CCY1219 TaxID=2886104 RepID=UPI002D1E5730|nr:hypothetical protein [Phormidium sp. CCY1219]MEB3827047.1 hypothetical protein [Phormidium sp. CCY1219]